MWYESILDPEIKYVLIMQGKIVNDINVDVLIDGIDAESNAMCARIEQHIEVRATQFVKGAMEAEMGVNIDYLRPLINAKMHPKEK